MIVTGVVQGDELDQVSAEGVTYEEAKELMLSRIPAGQQLIVIHADRDS